MVMVWGMEQGQMNGASQEDLDELPAEQTDRHGPWQGKHTGAAEATIKRHTQTHGQGQRQTEDEQETKHKGTLKKTMKG